MQDIDTPSLLFSRLKQFSGRVEVHLTAQVPTADERAFEALCKHLGGKSVLIELARGETVRQPMLCKHIHLDPHAGEAAIAHLSAAVSESWQLLRVKIEAGLTNLGIPETAREANALPQDCYFEHHIKVKYPAGNYGDIFGKLLPQMPEHGAHISRNARAKHAELETRFITQRVRNGREGARTSLADLRALIGHTPLEICDVVREFNIYDSRCALDAGWIP